MKRRFNVHLVVLLSSLALHGAALAEFDEALRAFQAKDYPSALGEARKADAAGDVRSSYLLGIMLQAGLGVTADPAQAAALYEKAAKGGVVGAYSKLALAYARGAGVARDKDKALALARRAAQLGDPEGAYVLSVVLTNEYLGYLDAAGKPDIAKYTQLAKRPIAERTLDTEARDALYWAAGKGQPQAVLTLALALGATVGDGNRQKMQAILDKMPDTGLPALQNYGKVSRYMATLGDSLTTPQLFVDAQMSQTFAALMQACGTRDPKDAAKAPPPKLLKTAVTKPVANATYLPSKIAGYERAYMVAGQWEEAWTYSACDKTAVITVTFVADGLGGATYAAEAIPKKN